MAGRDDPEDIRGWQRLDMRTTTSGRLLPHDPARLAVLGIRHVINLALDEHPEALADEAALMADVGIAYTHIPVPFDAPTTSHFEAFKAALQDVGEEPVHVHCIANYRVSAFFYLLNRELGLAEDEARAMMQEQWDPLASDHPQAAPWRTLLTP